MASASGVLTGTLAGYSTMGDADPVFLTALEARSRRWLGMRTRSVCPFLEVGGGVGAMWAAGLQAGGLVGHVAAGLQGGGTGTQWWIALRERPAALGLEVRGLRGR